MLGEEAILVSWWGCVVTQVQRMGRIDVLSIRDVQQCLPDCAETSDVKGLEPRGSSSTQCPGRYNCGCVSWRHEALPPCSLGQDVDLAFRDSS